MKAEPKYCVNAECFMGGQRVRTHLAECLVCDRDLRPEREGIREYMANRYGTAGGLGDMFDRLFGGAS